MSQTRTGNLQSYSRRRTRRDIGAKDETLEPRTDRWASKRTKRTGRVETTAEDLAKTTDISNHEEDPKPKTKTKTEKVDERETGDVRPKG